MSGHEDHPDLEQLRQAYRPERVRTLFVGESPPAGGTFFYRGDSLLARYTREAFASAYGPYADMDQFLNDFRNRGCYLVDLCREPVDGLPRPVRRAARCDGVAELAGVLRDLRPARIVAVMMAIETHVRKAATMADLPAEAVIALPFPAMGHQRKYVEALVPLLRAMG